MTTAKLVRFVLETGSEYHWQGEIKEDGEVVLLVDIHNIEEFNKLFNDLNDDDGGKHCVMKGGYFGFEMARICEYEDILLTDVFKQKDSN